MIPEQIAAERRSPPRAPQGQPGVAEVRARVTELEQQTRTVIRQRPIVAVLAALGVGYLVARLVARVVR